MNAADSCRHVTCMMEQSLSFVFLQYEKTMCHRNLINTQTRPPLTFYSQMAKLGANHHTIHMYNIM